MLTTGAFNALLKTLEEPPPHVKFIFATTEPNKILPTIISRCQRFDLRRIPNAIIAKHLLHIAELEGVHLDEKAAYAIGKGAEGGMRDAQSMLDQLVAFCGGKIAEQDVLDIFGFTSGESVAQLARNILESDTVGALRAVYEQNEAGKDLGRFLSDLIQHFRTLLVQQADPEAASEDLSPELIQEIETQAQMANTEQLLRVVDGLAEVDSRMRWASNKRLHFELGVIAGVQSLNEVSISDVIDALDGGTSAELPRQAPRPQIAPPVRRAPAPVKAAEPVKVEEPVRASQLPVRSAEMVVREETPVPAPVVAAAPPPDVKAVEPEVVVEKEPVSDADFWPQFTALVQQRRQLIVPWIQTASLLGIARNTVKVGFPTSESFAHDSLMRPAQVNFLESLAKELTGQAMKFEFVLDPSLKAPEFSEMGLGLLDEPAPAPKPKAEPKPVAKEEAPKAAAAATSAEVPPPPQVDDSFYNDPLIQSAMVRFKAKLAPVG
jgi:DNA polymerase-3 subunit gamma/tau